MTVIEYGSALIVVDAGLMFPDEEMLGIDLVLPDFSYVLENREKALAVVLTHAHEDHVGALPYLLRELPDLPVYGTRLTLGLVNGKLGEHGLQGKVTTQEIASEDRVTLGPFEVEFLQVCHSIPDGVALAIHTPVGTVVHTGDFKLDQTPVDCRVTALHRFGELGQEGVLLLMSDSTNAETPGFTEPERSVGKSLESIFAQAPGRIIVASFASHIHRIQQVFETAAQFGRSVAVVVELLALFSAKPALVNFEKARDMVQDNWTCDGSKAKADFGFEQEIGLEAGIRETVDWYRAQGWLR